MSRIWKTVVLCLLLIHAVPAKPAANPYQIIDQQAQAQDVLREVTGAMGSQFGMRLSKPVEIHLVEPSVMDGLLTKSPYKGAEIGLYTGVKNGKHQVYVMKGWARDMCAGITIHELTHAWQEENAPYAQNQVLKEGFAMWVEYKYFDATGAYTYAQRIRETADPVYGVGFLAVLDAESAVGASGVPPLMRKANGVEDLPKGKSKAK